MSRTNGSNNGSADNTTIDVSELRKKWAADDLTDALEALTADFERIEDIRIAEDIVELFGALQTYLRVSHEALEIPPINGALNV